MARLRLYLTGLLTACLGACGGGGGSSSSPAGPQGSITLSTSAMVFVTNNPALSPAAQNVQATISTTATGIVYLRIVATGSAVANITNIQLTSETTGSGTVVPAPAANLGPGVYTSTITVTACTSDPNCTSGIIGTPQTINVTYTINGVIATTTALTYRLGLNPIPGDYTASIQLRAHPGFMATSSVGWLSASPSGATSGTVQLPVSLIAAQVDSFGSGDFPAAVTLTVPAANSIQIPVTLTIAKPQLDQATPHVTEAGRSGTVVLRGLFLDQLPDNGIELITPNGSAIPATLLTRVNATDLRITHPPLAAGSYALRMRSTGGSIVDRSHADLVAVARTNFAAGTLGYPASAGVPIIRSLLYDAERKALLVNAWYAQNNVITRDNDVLIRFTHDTTWSAGASTAIPYFDSMALTADGRELLVGTTAAFAPDRRPLISRRSPVTLVQTASLQAAGDNDYFGSLAVTSDNRVFALHVSACCSGPGWPLEIYLPRSNALLTVQYAPAPNFFSGFSRGTVAASGDGSRIVAAGQTGSGGDQGVYEFDASNAGNTLQRTPAYFDVTVLRFDRTGENLLIRGSGFLSTFTEFARVYNRNWAMRGSLPFDAYQYVMSPDGSRAYTYQADGRVHAYDLAGTLVNGLFPEIGSGVLPAGPPANIYDNTIAMAITSDGSTLFVAGDRQIAIVPTSQF